MRKRSKDKNSNNQKELLTDINTDKVDIGIQTDELSDNQQFSSSSTEKVSTTDLQTSNRSTETNTITTKQKPGLSVEIPFYRLTKSQKYCGVCDAVFDVKRNRSIEINSSIRLYTLLEHDIYIENKTRCCSKHVSNDSLKVESIESIKQNKARHCTIHREELIDIFNDMKNELRKNCSKINELVKNPPLNFDDAKVCLPEKAYQVLMGITRDQFDDLCSHIPRSKLRTSDLRTSRTAIAMLLVKLRLGISHETLCTLFGLENKRQVSRILDSANIALKQHFVPKYLGFNHITREEILKEHTRPLAQQLLANNDPNKAIIILDGTYVYIQKSANNLLQRRTYSLHKGKPLVKPMMVVSTDGYIISAMGPYLADGKNNDAEITKNIIYNNKEGMVDWLAANDVLVVDRGFRDVLEDLEKFGYTTKMPSFLRKGDKQFTTIQANETRLITKIRWVIESANGRVKQWRFFDHVVPNTMIEKIGDYFRIVCAIINRYRPVFVKDISKDQELGEKILKLLYETNKIKTFVQNIKSNTEKKLKWISMNVTNSTPNFPRMNFNELQELTLGVYQLKQARAYIAEHMSTDGAYSVKITNQRSDLLRAQVQSRHKANVKYDVYIQYDSKNITGWYCTCPNGSRVVGCCAHIASIIYYLSFGRYNPKELQPRSSIYYTSIIDAQEYSEISDVDSDVSDEDSNTLYTLI
ncbi:unnamed protein product [Rotaria socialis]|uniref:SWIM-type domain-containing protein n=1 Tax=Rotaria socialis TaxID=392032 RepID=A0A818WVX2_9BILA|nr:unnamed protein product [Rotaria socialis]CAF3425337.1 unnamed protein product [Rotaria socialis]CAF3533353.1 unnamed protein product [Rotaria socialis]CAF3551900.1 unnamed protein product [Rotaria socialis]CAF3731749.1 unnamed protein product [Rotaria socialis]